MFVTLRSGALLLSAAVISVGLHGPAAAAAPALPPLSAQLSSSQVVTTAAASATPRRDPRRPGRYIRGQRGLRTVSAAPAPAPNHQQVAPSPSAEVLVPGTAVPAVGSSFAPAACVRDYVVPHLVEGALSGDNVGALNAAIAAARSGDCLRIPPGTYRRSGNIDVPASKSGITILGAGRDRTVLLGTSPDKHGFRVLGADDIRLQDLTIDTVPVPGRTGLNQQGHSTLLLDPGSERFLGQDLLLRGARAAGFFAYGARDYHLHRVEVQDSLADAFHNTNGSSHGTFTDCVASNPGDDGWAMVAYGGGPATVPHDFVVTRFHMKGNGHGRGFGIVNSYGLTVHGPTLIERTSAAGILVARETRYGGTMHPVRDIRFLGGTRLVRTNHNTEDHGAVLIDNPEASQPVEGVHLEDLTVVDTGLDRHALPSHNIYVKGIGRISATLTSFRFLGSGPASLLGGRRTPDSVLRLDGWSPADGYRAG